MTIKPFTITFPWTGPAPIRTQKCEVLSVPCEIPPELVEPFRREWERLYEGPGAPARVFDLCCTCGIAQFGVNANHLCPACQIEVDNEID